MPESDLFHKIESVDLATRVYLQLKKAITTNALKPNEKIDIHRLSERLGVSRTPIKDAIARLSAEGLITVKPKVGTYVTPFTLEDMLELLPIRYWLETGYCDRIVNHFPQESLEELERIIALFEEMLEKKDEFDYFLYNELDAKFHTVLVGASGNRKLLQVYKSLNFHTQIFRFYYGRHERKLLRGHREHLQILEAIKAKDAQMFERVMKQHIVDGEQELLRMMGETEDSREAPQDGGAERV